MLARAKAKKKEEKVWSTHCNEERKERECVCACDREMQRQRKRLWLTSQAVTHWRAQANNMHAHTFVFALHLLSSPKNSARRRC